MQAESWRDTGNLNFGSQVRMAVMNVFKIPKQSRMQTDLLMRQFRFVL